MPKYSVSEVLDIIKNLTDQEKLELQVKLPEVLRTTPAINVPQTMQRQSPNLGNMSVTENIASQQNPTANLHEVLSLLDTLKQEISNNSNLDPLQKETAQAQVKVIEEELQKPEPDKNLVSHTISTLRQSLEGAIALAEPMMKIADLAAKVLGIPVP